jgi:hypothetical protein
MPAFVLRAQPPTLTLFQRSSSPPDEATQRFAEEVLRVHTRYAAEVVAAHRLCPFLREVETGLGAFCLMHEPSLDLALAIEAITTAKTSVLHLVYPRSSVSHATFWDFSSKLGDALKKAMPKAPVYAVFHPQMPGDTSNPHRMVGMLRHSPDPMLQFIPEGLSTGGTVFFGEALPVDPARETFARLQQGGLFPEVLRLIDDIRADRDRSYAAFSFPEGERGPTTPTPSA